MGKVGVRRSAPVLLGFLLLAGRLGLDVAPAGAVINDPRLTITMSVLTPQPTEAGDPITWQIRYACSSITADCRGAEIDVPGFVGQPGNIPAGFDFATFSASGSSHTTVATNEYGHAHWDFIDPLPAGSSGTLTMTVPTGDGSTPDDTVFSPVATFRADNADPATATASATVHAEADVQVEVFRGDYWYRPPPREPALDVDVSYTVELFNPTRGSGDLGIESSSVSVELPTSDGLAPRSMPTDNRPSFVSATSGGTYDGTTNTVTWVPSSYPSGYFDFRLGLVVHYATGHGFTGDSDPATAEDEITLVARAMAKPYGQPTGPDVTDAGSEIHGFDPPPTVNAAFGKCCTLGDIVVYPSTTNNTTRLFELYARNDGNVPARLDILDRMPCPRTSTATCEAPNDVGVEIRTLFANSPISSPVDVTYTTNKGRTKTVTINTSSNFIAFGGYFPGDPNAFDPGERVASLHLTGTLAAGRSINFILNGRVPADYPDDPTQDPDRIENCAVFSLDAPDDHSGTTACGYLHVAVSSPEISPYLDATNTGGSAPGDPITWRHSLYNPGSAPLHPVSVVVLPPEVEFVPGSGHSAFLAGSMNGVEPTFDVVERPDGATIVRASWPGGEAIDPGSSSEVQFTAKVRTGTAPGTYVATSAAFDTTVRNACFDRFFDLPDGDDLDGDGDTEEGTCSSYRTFTVVKAASMSVAAEVQGADDDDFRAPPAVGFTQAGEPATYRLSLRNQGNVDLSNVVAYDLLPTVGDTGVGGQLAGVARGSLWRPVLTQVPDVPAGLSVQYSTATNPCRGEVIAKGGALADGPVGCTDDWSDAPPANLSTVTALRLVVDGPMEPGALLQLELSMSSPTSPAPAGVAWNSVAAAASNAELEDPLEPTESPRVGLASTADLRLTKVHDGDTFTVGEQGSYTLTARNLGPGSIAGTTKITDPLPNGLTLSSASGTGWTCDGAPGDLLTCTTTATVAKDTDFEPITVVVDVGDAAVPSVTNTATVHNLSDADPENDDGEDTVAVAPAPIAGLGLTRSPIPESRVVPGGLFTFTVTVANHEADETTLTELHDTVYGDLVAPDEEEGGEDGGDDVGVDGPQTASLTAAATTLGSATTCTLPQTLAPSGMPGATYTCTFTGSFTGAVAASQAGTLTITGIGPGGAITASATSTIRLTAVPPAHTYACAAATDVGVASAVLHATTDDPAVAAAHFTLTREGEAVGVALVDPAPPFAMPALPLLPATTYSYTVSFDPGAIAGTGPACSFTTSAAAAATTGETTTTTAAPTTTTAAAVATTTTAPRGLLGKTGASSARDAAIGLALVGLGLVLVGQHRRRTG